MSVIGQNQLKLKIESFRIVENKNENLKIKTLNSSALQTVLKPFVKYQINVNFGKIAYNIEKRFSEIYKFYRNLIEALEKFQLNFIKDLDEPKVKNQSSKSSSNKNLNSLSQSQINVIKSYKKAILNVTFPSRTLFVNLSEKFLENRKDQLQFYFNFLNELFLRINNDFLELMELNSFYEETLNSKSKSKTKSIDSSNASTASLNTTDADDESSSYESISNDGLQSQVNEPPFLQDQNNSRGDSENDNNTCIDSSQIVSNFYQNISKSAQNFKLKLKILGIFSNFFGFNKCEVNTVLVSLCKRLSCNNFTNDGQNFKNETGGDVLESSNQSAQLSILEIYSLDYFFRKRNFLTLISDKSIATIIDNLKDACRNLEVVVNNENNFMDVITHPISLNFSKILSPETSTLIFSNFPIYLLENFSSQNFPNLAPFIKKLIFTSSPDLICPGQLLASEIYTICHSLSSKNVIYSHLISKSEFSWENLQHLDISNNQISYLDCSIFYLARNLQYLDLSNNKLREISATSFSLDQGVKLKYLDLSGNRQLKKLPSFYNVRLLEKLIISNTFLDELSFLTSELVNLKYLDCANCQFSEYNMVVTLNLLPTLSSISFLGNSICQNHDYRCKILSFCNKAKDPECKTNFVLDGTLISVNEVLTAEVISAMDEYEKEAEFEIY